MLILVRDSICLCTSLSAGYAKLLNIPCSDVRGPLQDSVVKSRLAGRWKYDEGYTFQTTPYYKMLLTAFFCCCIPSWSLLIVHLVKLMSSLDNIVLPYQPLVHKLYDLQTLIE